MKNVGNSGAPCIEDGGMKRGLLRSYNRQGFLHLRGNIYIYICARMMRRVYGMIPWYTRGWVRFDARTCFEIIGWFVRKESRRM